VRSRYKKNLFFVIIRKLRGIWSGQRYFLIVRKKGRAVPRRQLRSAEEVHGSGDIVPKDSLKKTLRGAPKGMKIKAKGRGPVVRERTTGVASTRQLLADSIIKSSRDMIVAVDKDRRIIEFNKAAEKTLGYRASEVLGKPVDILYADQAEASAVDEAVSRSGSFSGEITNRCKDGKVLRNFISSSPLRNAKGQTIGRISISHAMTEYRMAEEALRESERFLNTIFDSINDPFSILDRNYRIVRANEAYAQMRGRHAADMIGRRCYELLENRGDVCVGCVVKKTFDSSDPCAKDKRLISPDGGDIWVEIFTYPILDDEGAVSHVIEYTRDITDRMKAEEEKRRLIGKLEYLSNTDMLTGLLNRRALMDKLAYEAGRARRYASELSLILCDIDFFKQINDAYGHAVGDRVLRAVAGILRGSLREADIVGRYGGDEFMLVLPQTSFKGAEDFAERVRAAVGSAEVRIGAGKSVSISLSLGVASVERSRNDFNVNALVRDADKALYTAKRTGRNKVSVVTRA
jgi:diguanylate cyclase (GGDEF)-like protein/PAS domain S-box-containing protein